jgi:drug/metabolite transporter (DMT)-like permease
MKKWPFVVIGTLSCFTGAMFLLLWHFPFNPPTGFFWGAIGLCGVGLIGAAYSIAMMHADI